MWLLHRQQLCSGQQQSYAPVTSHGHLEFMAAFLDRLTVIAVLSGHIRLNVHGFGMIVVSQAIWFISAGVLLWKEKQEPAQLASA